MRAATPASAGERAADAAASAIATERPFKSFAKAALTTTSAVAAIAPGSRSSQTLTPKS